MSTSTSNTLCRLSDLVPGDRFAFHQELGIDAGCFNSAAWYQVEEDQPDVGKLHVYSCKKDRVLILEDLRRSVHILT